jgi:hypothetical protein
MEEVIRIVAFDPETEGVRVTVRISGSGAFPEYLRGRR